MQKRQDWENPQVVEINREAPRATAEPYPDIDSAGGGKPSPWIQSLNGVWKFRLSPYPASRPEDFYREEFVTGEWDDITVPSLWQLQGHDVPRYNRGRYPSGMKTLPVPSISQEDNPVGYYRRTFNVPSGRMEGRQALLSFGAVRSAFYLWINGQNAGYSQGSMVNAEFNITPFLKTGMNTIAVEVYSCCDGSWLEGYDTWQLNGICRDVLIRWVPDAHIRDFHVTASPDAGFTDGLLQITVALRNYGYTQGDVFTLEALLYDSKGRKVQMQEGMSRSLTVAAGSGSSLKFSSPVKSPRLWSAEDPCLYSLFLVLRTQKGEAIEVVPCDVGFRSVEIEGGRFLVNGRPVVLKGVKRHDFDPFNGFAVPAEIVEQDIILMKRNNINAVRTGHYPNSEIFYTLCDRYGLYVVDECELATQGLFNRFAGSAGKWTRSCVDRMVRMVARDRNHPCIVMWSPGNCSGSGENFRSMKEAAMELDRSRPFHCGGDRKLEISDVISLNNSSPAELDKICNEKNSGAGAADGEPSVQERKPEPAAGENEDRPRILSEFSSSMGNSLGNLKEYADIFESHPGLAGGFIRDFADQCLAVARQDGSRFWAYGGDFGEEPNGGAFCAGGIVMPDRSPKPALFEVKKAYENIVVEAVNPLRGEFIVRNRFSFLALDGVAVKWSVTSSGSVIQKGVVMPAPVPAGGVGRICVPVKSPVIIPGSEYHIMLEFVLKTATDWAPAGHVVAWEQFPLPLEVPPMPKPEQNPRYMHPVAVEEKKDSVFVAGMDFEIRISKVTGAIESLVYFRKQYIKGPMRPNFWRVPTDNDMGSGKSSPSRYKPGQWKNADSRRKVKKVLVNFQNACSVSVTVLSSLYCVSGSHRIIYTITGDGEISIEMAFKPRCDMKRVGMQVKIPLQYGIMTWFGRGPHETMPDRKNGAPVGLYSGKVPELVHNYVRPQENGNRSDVRWVSFNDAGGEGIRIQHGEGGLLGVSAWPCSMEDLENAAHPHEIPERDYITVNIDHAQEGAGGDLQGLPTVHEDYKLKKNREYRYGFTISSFSS